MTEFTPTIHDFSSLFICCGTVLSSVGDEAQIVDGHLTARAFLRLLQLQQSRAGAGRKTTRGCSRRTFQAGRQLAGLSLNLPAPRSTTSIDPIPPSQFLMSAVVELRL